MDKENGSNNVNGELTVVISATTVDAMLTIGFAVVLIAVAFMSAYVPLLFSLSMGGVAMWLLPYLRGKMQGQPRRRLFVIACSLWLLFHIFVLIAEYTHGKALPDLSLCLFLSALVAVLCCNRMAWLGAFLFPVASVAMWSCGGMIDSSGLYSAILAFGSTACIIIGCLCSLCRLLWSGTGKVWPFVVPHIVLWLIAWWWSAGFELCVAASVCAILVDASARLCWHSYVGCGVQNKVVLSALCTLSYLTPMGILQYLIYMGENL